MERKLYSLKDLVAILDLSANTIRRKIAQRRFPRPIYPAGRAPRWTQDMVDCYLKALSYGILLGDGSESEGCQEEVEAPGGSPERPGVPNSRRAKDS